MTTRDPLAGYVFGQSVPLSYGRWMYFSRPTALITRCLLTLSLAFLLSSCTEAPNAAATPVPSGANAAASPATPFALPADQALPQSELASIFETAKNLLAEAKTAAVFSQFRAGQQVQLTPAGDSLKVTATGDDPQVFLPAFTQGKQFIIQAIVESPTDTVMEMYYLRRGTPDYTNEQSQSAPLVKGRNVVYFRLNAPDLIDPLRMDIGAAPGNYTVVSMIARVLPSPAP